VSFRFSTHVSHAPSLALVVAVAPRWSLDNGKIALTANQGGTDLRLEVVWSDGRGVRRVA
jgi:hypothetical protein